MESPESPVKIVRGTLNLSQIELAQMAGVSQSHISCVEAGIADIDPKLAAFFETLDKDLHLIVALHKEFMEHKKES